MTNVRLPSSDSIDVYANDMGKVSIRFGVDRLMEPEVANIAAELIPTLCRMLRMAARDAMAPKFEDRTAIMDSSAEGEG